MFGALYSIEWAQGHEYTSAMPTGLRSGSRQSCAGSAQFGIGQASPSVGDISVERYGKWQPQDASREGGPGLNGRRSDWVIWIAATPGVVDLSPSSLAYASLACIAMPGARCLAGESRGSETQGWWAERQGRGVRGKEDGVLCAVVLSSN